MLNSVVNGVKGFFSGLGKLLHKALTSAFVDGLTDEVIKAAYEYAKVAATKLADNAEKREFVVKLLMSKFGLSENIARLGVELGYRLFKEELKKDRF